MLITTAQAMPNSPKLVKEDNTYASGIPTPHKETSVIKRGAIVSPAIWKEFWNTCPAPMIRLESNVVTSHFETSQSNVETLLL